MQKHETVETFQRRLRELIARTGLSRARFAARAAWSDPSWARRTRISWYLAVPLAAIP